MPPRRSASFFASTNKSTLRAPFAAAPPFGWPKVALMLLTWAEETVIPLDFKVAMMSFGTRHDALR